MSEYKGKYPKDYADQSIVPGDTIVYPVRRGNNMWLTDAKVSTVARRGGEWYIEGVTLTKNGRTQRVIIKQPARCVVVDI